MKARIEMAKRMRMSLAKDSKGRKPEGPVEGGFARVALAERRRWKSKENVQVGCLRVWFPLARRPVLRSLNARYLKRKIQRGSQLAGVETSSGWVARLAGFADSARERMSSWKRRAATISFGALALVMAYGVVFGHNGLTAFAHKREEAKALQEQMQVLQKENDRLRGHAERLQNDPSAIEHEAREELHYTRAGEVIVTLPVERVVDAK